MGTPWTTLYHTLDMSNIIIGSKGVPAVSGVSMNKTPHNLTDVEKKIVEMRHQGCTEFEIKFACSLKFSHYQVLIRKLLDLGLIEPRRPRHLKK